jgi:hypothetical protein
MPTLIFKKRYYDTQKLLLWYHNFKIKKNILWQFLCQVKPLGMGIPKITSPLPWALRAIYVGNAPSLGLCPTQNASKKWWFTK